MALLYHNAYTILDESGGAISDPALSCDANSATYGYVNCYPDPPASSLWQTYNSSSNASQNCAVYVIGAKETIFGGAGAILLSWNGGSTYTVSCGFTNQTTPTATPTTKGPFYSWNYLKAAINTNAIYTLATAWGDWYEYAKGEVQLNETLVYYESRLAAPSSPSCTPGTKKNTVSWSAVGSATKYYLFWGTSASLTESSSYIDVGNATNYEHTSLTVGQPYYYKVAAFLNYGPGTQSSEVNGTPLGPASSKGYITSF